ncbi:MAG TPA: tripartite tricarboxylate transporter substrate binding protein [Xanthobacteraceae bacterium]|nr:tripartite tricarboxylate transporter substrate binding protein [Xanthobacteraceae bacterium]
MKHAVWIAAAVLLATPAAFAQSYPTKPIRLVSPNPPGGANDTLARIMAAKLAGIVGGKIIIDNRGGAGGQIGGELVARAAPDGYTLLMASVSTHSFAPLTSPQLPYDPIKDFAPISMFAVVQNVLVVNPSLPAQNVKELIALAKKSPGALKYASGGIGSTSHFAVAMFVSVAGIGKDTLHLPYKGGAPSMVATMSNETQFYLGPIPGMVPLIQAGKVRAIAITGDRRSPSLPDVPTLAEIGLGGAESSGWFGPLAPAGTPAPIIERLHQAVVQSTQDADVLKGLAAQGVEPATNSPAEFATYIANTLARYRTVVAAENLKFE